MSEKNQSVFIVEDEFALANVMAEQLVNAGYKIWNTTVKGDDAVEMLDKAAVKPDVILMDVMLAGSVDGIEASRRILLRHDVPIVFVTARSDEKTLARIQGVKPYGYLVKPVSLVELIFAVGLAIEQHRLKLRLEKEGGARKLPVLTPVPVASSTNGGDKSETEAVSALNTIAMFRLLPPEIVQSIYKQSSRRFYEAGENLALEGSTQNYGFVVVKGQVSIIKTSDEHARDLIVDIILPGDASGMLIIMESGPFTFTARAQMDSDVILIGTDLLLSVFEQDPQCYREILRDITVKLKTSQNMLKCLAYDSVERRIAETLAFLAAKAGVPGKGTNLPTIHLTRRELADYTGTTVETAYRVTKRMEREGLLHLPTPGCIAKIDVEKLLASK